MNNESEACAAVDRCWEASKRRDPAGILAVYAEGAEIINPNGKAITRLDLAEAVREFDPGTIEWKVLTRTASGDRVIEEVEYFAKGQSIGVLTSVYTIANGKIVSERMYANSVLLMKKFLARHEARSSPRERLASGSAN